MAEHKFKTVKVFSTDDMPQEVIESIDYVTKPEYIDITLNLNQDKPTKLDAWLKEHGALRGESVIIEYNA